MFDDLIFEKSHTEGESLIEKFNQRRQTLQEVRLKLKDDFVGIDNIIDSLIEKIEAWYVMPESMRRPAIICLWGMTGIGKTDLVRKLVRYLNFSDRFLEIQMASKGTVNKGFLESNSIQSKIEFSNLEANEPGILFLDEIQRYRTKDEEGKAVPDAKAEDIWQLLSDGKFSSDTRRMQLLELLYSDYMYDWNLKKEKEDDGQVLTSKYKRGYYTAKNIKKILKLDNVSISEIMEWSEEEKEARIREAMRDERIFEGDDYSKLLIIISGNIDEAYNMSLQVGDGDTDADILHEFSKDINFLTIKEALLKRFYPEQIARFGNNHIIYPSLSKNSYKEVINLSLNRIANDLLTERGISITFSSNVRDFIYRNGVFPTQGVRPVFSTIYASIENLIPKVVIASIENNVNNIFVEYNSKDKNFDIYAENQILFSVNHDGDIDRIKNETAEDAKMLYAVHEIGHAIIYSHFFGLAPTQIEPNASQKGAFIGIHKMAMATKETYLKKVKALLGGYAAEKVVFGETSSGTVSDLMMATSTIKAMIKSFGMGQHLSVIGNPMARAEELELAFNVQTGLNEIEMIDSFLKDALDEVEELLNGKYKELLINLSNQLYQNQKMSLETYIEICQKHNLSAKIMSPDQRIITNYLDKFRRFAEGN